MFNKNKFKVFFYFFLIFDYTFLYYIQYILINTMAKQSNDIIKFEIPSYSSINKLFTKVLGINNRSLTILQGLTNAMVTPDDFVDIVLKDEKGNNVLYRIPSITQISGKVVDMRATLELLRQQKTLEYTEVEYNKLATYSEPNKIKTLPRLGNVNLKDNPKFKMFLDRMFSIDLDLTIDYDENGQLPVPIESVSLLAKNLKIREYCIKYDDIAGFDAFYDLLKYENYNELERFLAGKDTLDNTLLYTHNAIPYEMSEKVMDLEPLQLEQSGEFLITEIIQDNLVEEVHIQYEDVVLFRKKVVFDNVIVNERTDDSFTPINARYLRVGDKLIKNYVNIYDIVSDNVLDKNGVRIPNAYEIQYTQGASQLILMDKLQVASRLYNIKKVPYNFHPNYLTILFFKSISPNLFIENSNYSTGLLIAPHEITYKDENGETNARQYFYDYIYDYEEFFLGLQSEMAIPATSGLKPNTPVLNENNFQVIRTSNVTWSDDETINELLSKLSFYNNLIATLTNEQTELASEILSCEQQHGRGSTECENIVKRHQEVSDEILHSNALITKVRTDLQVLEFANLENLNATQYQMYGWWDVPEPQIDPRGRVQDIIAFDVEISFLDQDENPRCTPGINFTNKDDETIRGLFPEQTIITTTTRKKVWNPLTGRFAWDFIHTSTLEDAFNTIQHPIRPFDIVKIRARSVSEAGYPNNAVRGDWSEAIFVKFPNEFLNITNIADYQSNMIRNAINTSTSDLMISNLTEQINTLKAELANYKRREEQYEHFVVDTAILQGNGKFVIEFVPDVITLMIFNRQDGTLLNPLTDYELSNNNREISFTISYLTAGNGLQLGDNFLVKYIAIRTDDPTNPNIECNC